MKSNQGFERRSRPAEVGLWLLIVVAVQAFQSKGFYQLRCAKNMWSPQASVSTLTIATQKTGAKRRRLWTRPRFASSEMNGWTVNIPCSHSNSIIIWCLTHFFNQLCHKEKAIWFSTFSTFFKYQSFNNCVLINMLFFKLNLSIRQLHSPLFRDALFVNGNLRTDHVSKKIWQQQKANSAEEVERAVLLVSHDGLVGIHPRHEILFFAQRERKSELLLAHCAP